MAARRLIGSLPQDSDLTSAFVEAGDSSSGTTDSFLSASGVSRSRQAHQIIACCLYKQRKAAYNSLAEIHLKVHKVFLISKCGVRRSTVRILGSCFSSSAKTIYDFIRFVYLYCYCFLELFYLQILFLYIIHVIQSSDCKVFFLINDFIFFLSFITVREAKFCLYWRRWQNFCPVSLQTTM